MSSGYTRQAAANIGAGLTIASADLNAEFNQIQSGFDGTTGHDHSGGSGLGPKISLTASISGILPIANGGTNATSFTAGSVLFSDGTRFQQDNGSFFWDNANNRLGIGTAAPNAQLQVHTASATTTGMRISNSTSGATVTDGFLLAIDGATTVTYVWNYEPTAMVFATNNLERMRIQSGGNVSIGNTNNVFALDITGSLNISGNYRIAGTLLAASHLSNGTTGSGAVMLAASPTTTGTLTAGAISSGAITASGTSTLNTLQLTNDLAIAEGGTAASTAATAFANIAVAASSLATPGYIKFQNGLIFQWGYETFVTATSAPVVFPIPFPSTLFTLHTSLELIFPASQDCGTSATSVAGFTVSTTSTYSGKIYWFAVGI